ncbi:MAG: MFS transporter [ANME-2 cluster archaeon]|nr:MFS transporter [ANME-2 cluster archaeon]
MIVLGLVSLFTDVASEMLYPIVPIFLTVVLGAPMTVVGLIEGIAESSANILKVISGWYTDRTTLRKPFVIAGYSISAISKPVMALAYGWPLVLVARLMDRTGKGLRTSARDALIADSSDTAHMGRSFGLHRSMDTIGAVAGPFITLGILFFSGDNYRLVFLAAFIPGLLSILLVTFYVKEHRRPEVRKISFKISDLGRDYKILLMITGLFAMGNSSNVFLILRAEDLGFSLQMVILSYILFNIVSSLVSFPLGTLSDKWGRRNIMSAGFVVFGIVYFGFAWTQSGIYIWPLFIIYGIYEALTEGIGKAYVVDIVPLENRGTALGIYHAATGFMMLFASIIAGLLWDILTPAAPFIYGGGLALLSSLSLVLFMPNR